MTVYVTALYRYPIKSCKGHALQTAVTDARGIIGDRSMMIVDAYGEFITQRELPGLALIEPRFNDDGALTLLAPDMPDVLFHPSNHGRRVNVTVWNDRCEAVDQGNAVAEWLQDFLGTPVRLVRIADGFERKVDPCYARNERDQTGFSDGYPFLLASEASLNDLNARLDTPVPMNRFRPNIVVSECDAFAEDTWRDIRIHGIALRHSHD